MSKVRAHMGVSLDGFTAGTNQRLDKPFGDGAEHLMDWVFGLKSARELFGMEGGGETGPSDDVFQEGLANVGAVVMGRNMFGGGHGPWDEAWRGWWGENPPYHTDVFVVTHYAREPLAMEGGNTFYFVTEGVEEAVTRARASAGDKDVLIAGGANVVRQCLTAGLLDELQIHLAPTLVGAGESLLGGLGSAVTLEQDRVVPGTGVTHIRYRVVK